jgi:hypothetical protein
LQGIRSAVDNVGHDKLTLVAMAGDNDERVSVVCPECGAVRPMTTVDHPPGYAEYLWNQRYGVN